MNETKLRCHSYRRARGHSDRDRDVIVVRSGGRSSRSARSIRDVVSEAGDVIDLGAPRLLRRVAPERRKAGRTPRSRRPYTPNPRLYPGARPKPKPRSKRIEPRSSDTRGRRRKRVFRRAVPNARLYRPAPPRPPPPPAWPRTSWPPPAPPAPARLDTASRAALRLSEHRRGPRERPRQQLRTARSPGRAARSPARASRPTPPARSPRPAPPAPAQSPPPEPPSRRLVVTLPAAPAEAASHYHPASEHFRLLSLDTDSGASTPVVGRPPTRTLPPVAPTMDAGNRHSTSPEDCSDGNETLSAPSEFLAEFLSAIMRRQYAEALKYCRLILQYEPHNATARGFYPLLQHKLRAQRGAERARGSSSEDASALSDQPPPAPAPPVAQELMEHSTDVSDASATSGLASRSSSRASGASQSSLELDSSDALAHSEPSLSLSRRTDRTDSASGGCWESTGSASRSEPDDNGNAPRRAADSAAAADENDNAHQSESSSSLRRLRAQFTCSIK